MLALVIVCAGLTIGPVPSSFADAPVEAPTAAELYRQGASRYAEGDLAGARQLFRRVDPMQLPRQDRVELYETLQEIDRALNADTSEPMAEPADDAGPTPVELLARADEVSDTSPTQAADLYQQVMASPMSGDSLKAVAAARLAQARRRANSGITDARRQLDLANADLEAGDVNAASQRVESVRDSGVELGWFDQQRLERLSQAVQERQDAAAPEAAMAQAAEQQATEEATTAQAEEDAQPVAAEVQQAESQAAAATAQSPETEEEAQQQVEALEQATQTVREAAEDTDDEDLLETVRRLSARQAVAEAEQAELQGNFNVAIRKYQQALRLDPEVEGAADQLAALQARRGEDFVAEGALGELTRDLGLTQQAVVAEYNRAMNTARARMDAGNYRQALESANEAKIVLDSNPQALPPQQQATLRTEAETLTNEIFRRQELAAAVTVRQQEEAQQREIRETRQSAERERDAEVQRLLKRARELQIDQMYDEALELIQQALFLDPTNIAAQLMRDVIQDTRAVVNARNLKRQQSVMIVEQENLTREAAIPYSELITYPADWPELSDTRLEGLDLSGGESEANRRVTQRLREPVPINFEANRLINVIDYFRNTTSLNFFVNWPALEAIGVEQDTPVSLQLNNVPADRALTLVLQQAGAASEFDPIGYSVIDGIVTISTLRDLQKTTDLRPYDIRDLLVQVPNFTDAPSFDLREALSNTSSGGGGGTGGGSGSDGGLFGDDGGDDDEEDALSREERVTQITSLIQDTVGDPLDWQDAGGTVSSMRELDGQLIIKTTPENHRQIAALLAQLRETRAIQISVEARFLLVDQNFLEEVGVDLDLQIDDPGGNFGPISIGQDSMTLGQRATTSLSPDRWNIAETDDPGAFIPGQGFNPTGRAFDFGVSYIDDLEVNLLVRATQANHRSVSLTAPRVTFFNGQRAYVLVVRQISFVSELEAIPDAIGFDITVSVLQVGVLLDVEGTVSADRRYVTLTLRPNLATTQEPFRQIEQIGALVLDGDDDGADQIITFTGTLELPELELTQVKATVSVPDKGTLLLGGQRLMAETEVEAGVPVLSKVPVLSRFFTNTSTVKDSRTLLILIRPTIIIQSEEEQNLFPGLIQDAGQFNVGNGF